MTECNGGYPGFILWLLGFTHGDLEGICKA